MEEGKVAECGQKLQSIITLCCNVCSVYGGKGRGGRMLVLLNPIYIVQYNIKACEICQEIMTKSDLLQKLLKINV